MARESIARPGTTSLLENEVARVRALLYEIEVHFDFTTFQPTHSTQIEGNCFYSIYLLREGTHNVESLFFFPNVHLKLASTSANNLLLFDRLLSCLQPMIHLFNLTLRNHFAQMKGKRAFRKGLSCPPVGCIARAPYRGITRSSPSGRCSRKSKF
uniref:Uncharacterized protein n=1 Tax=Chrysopogon zizanioides TaxID=167337 RepID=A0A7T3RB44_9POAL|nr:hypothetical protein KQ334_mgp063 [Chrysopogon zizanioides]QPZ94332.1 hypothetical protein [Chrysopogon zizanioides]